MPGARRITRQQQNGHGLTSLAIYWPPKPSPRRLTRSSASIRNVPGQRLVRCFKAVTVLCCRQSRAKKLCCDRSSAGLRAAGGSMASAALRPRLTAEACVDRPARPICSRSPEPQAPGCASGRSRLRRDFQSGSDERPVNGSWIPCPWPP